MAFWRVVILVLLVTSNASVLQARKGEFGADTRLLDNYFTAPQGPGESNFYFDMWGGGALREFLTSHGLTNNKALIVLSHGRGFETKMGMRYGYYPDDKVCKSASKPMFSAQDFAAYLGAEACEKIHNVVIAGCNEESAFRVEEIRMLFVNATNVTHAPAGKNGYELVFRHGLIHPSAGIRVLYEMPDDFALGDFSPARKPKKYTPYIAQLFQPGSLKPYKIQTAGRELLDPDYLSASTTPIANVKQVARTTQAELLLAEVHHACSEGEPVAPYTVATTPAPPRPSSIYLAGGESEPPLIISLRSQLIKQFEWSVNRGVQTPALLGLVFFLTGTFSLLRGFSSSHRRP